MFESFGKVAARHWAIVLAGWVVLLIGMISLAPRWESVIEDGEFRYLPANMPSREAQRVFQAAFSRDLLGSSVVVVISRERGHGLTDADREFIEKTLKPRLEEIARTNGGLYSDEDDKAANGDADAPRPPAATAAANREGETKPLVVRIRTYTDAAVGHLLTSSDKKASLVMIELSSEFMEMRNKDLIEKIEELVREKGRLFEENQIPGGLSLKLSGSAIVGRDMRSAARHSAEATERWTVVLVLVLLVAIYRSPVLALIPLVTVAAALEIAMSTLSLLAKAGVLHLFSGVETYVTVVLYGAGVDFCVFLMARYKEELDAGGSFDDSIAAAVKKVGAAITASAGTTMCGIGMMGFAEFGKFKQAGIAMSLSLFFVLAASLTFTPALLRLAGRFAFWPNMPSEQVSSVGGWLSPTSLMAKLMEHNWFLGIWDRIGQAILKRPLTIWLSCIGVMVPFAFFGVMNFNNLSYGLLSELPSDSTSVAVAQEVQEYFPAGATAPMTALLVNRNLNFADKATGIEAVRELTERLDTRKEELGIYDIRSVSHPLGSEGGSSVPIWKRGGINLRAPEYYVSDKGDLAGHVTRIDLVLKNDPFSRGSIEQFDKIKQAIAADVAAIPNGLSQGSELQYVGATANMRDLKEVTGRDQWRVDMLVVVAVFLVLVILLRRIAICGYLIVTVLFSYLVTLGVAFAAFWLLDPAGFSGLDWKVPVFLFTILIAVGEDYNIYLFTRIEEEQLLHGPVEGVPVALAKTGGIISSCGVIMAGTFASLTSGTLEGMKQLGFALAFGVLLDTFVVRPILVPAYLVLLHSGRFGIFGKILGAQHEPPRQLTHALHIGTDPTDATNT